MIAKCFECGLCCRLFLVNLTEEEYRSGKYQTQFKEIELVDDFREANVHGANILKQKEDDSCIYLKKNKCSIHRTKPEVCRKFFCTSKLKKFKTMIEQIREKQDMKYQQGFTFLGILLIITFSLVVATGIFITLSEKPASPFSLFQNSSQPTPFPQPTPTLFSTVKIEAEIYQKLTQDGKVPIIITLYGSSVEQTLRELNFSSDEFRLGYKWENLLSFSGAVYKKSVLEKLVRHSNVKSVTLG